MNRNLILIFFLLATSVFHTQNAVVKEVLSIDANKYFGFDTYNNYYYSKQDVLYRTNHFTTIEYQNPALGKIERVDFYNPLMVVVFYKDFNSVILLDNQFNEITKISFSNIINPILVSNVGISGQNELWFFDELTQKIGLINIKSKKINFISNVLPCGIIESFANYNYFSFIDQCFDVYTINRYGKITKNSKVEKFDELLICNENTIVYNYQSKMYVFNIKNSTFRELNIDAKPVKDYYYQDGILSIFTGTEIVNYKLNF